MKFLCYFGIHFWNIIKEKHKVTDHPTGREFIRVIVRECEFCGKRQYNRRLSKGLNFYSKWKSFTFSKNSTIKLKDIN